VFNLLDINQICQKALYVEHLRQFW